MIKNVAFGIEPEILQGLMSGDLVRMGGVIRQSAGSASGGRIVRHLIEIPARASSMSLNPLMIAARTADIGVNSVGHGVTWRKLGRIDGKLGTVLGMSQLSAAGSALNLGALGLGFGYMADRLSRIDRSIDRIQEGLDTVQAGQERVSRQLDYLVLLNRSQHAVSEEILGAVKSLEMDNTMSWLHGVTSALEHYERTRTGGDWEVAFDKDRRDLQHKAQTLSPSKDSRNWVSLDVCVQGWLAATLLKCALDESRGDRARAVERLSRTAEQMAAVTGRWTNELLQDDNKYLGTAYRLSAPVLQNEISSERVARIARFSIESDEMSPEERALRARVELGVTRFLPTQEWQDAQIGLAEFLDGLAELSDRMASKAILARRIQEAGEDTDFSGDVTDSSRSDWEPGLYMVELPSEGAATGQNLAVV